VSLVFRERSHLIHKAERGFEVGKRELPLKMMVVRDFPLRNLAFQGPDFGSSQRRHSASAGDACLFCES